MALGENRKNVPEQAIVEEQNWLECSGTKETECKIRQITMKASGIFQWMKYSLKHVSEGCIESQFRAEHRAKTMESPIIVPEHALFQLGILGHLSGTWFRNTQVT